MAQPKAIYTKPGAGIRPLYVERQLKAWAITDAELQMLGTLDRMSTVFWSLATLSAGFALGVWWTGATSTDPTVQVMGHFVFRGSIGVAIICGSMAGYFAKTRGDHVAQIKRDGTSSE